MLSSHDPAGGTTPAAFRHRTSSFSTTTTTTSASSPSPSRTMEEVWNDITLDFVPGTPSVHHRPNTTAAATAVSPTFRSLILQGFLNCPTSAAVLPNAADEDAGGSLQRLSPGNKRLLDPTDGAPADRHHKRMIKNRESAARSRARKQAYVNELEFEVAQLKEENSRLREQQQKQILQVSTVVQVHNKRALHRTLTAPF